MTRFLGRLKTLLAEDAPTRQTDRTDKSPSVSFVSDQGKRVSRSDGADASAEVAIEERAGVASNCVPSVYLDAWARLNCQRPASVPEAEWRLALDDGGRFLDAWGDEAAEVGWTPGELFAARAGLAWRLAGERVEAIGRNSVRLSDGRTFPRHTPAVKGT
jgi:hypothetical protein